MITKSIDISLKEAQDFYSGDNETLKELAVRAFPKTVLESSYKRIRYFEDACNALGLNANDVETAVRCVAKISHAAVAMLKVSIIRKALNLGYKQELRNGEVYYPYLPLYNEESVKSIGKFKCDGKVYSLVSGDVFSENGGLTHSSKMRGVDICANTGDNALFGCATKEIAEHFGKYFGVLITIAKFGDNQNFEQIKD